MRAALLSTLALVVLAAVMIVPARSSTTPSCRIDNEFKLATFPRDRLPGGGGPRALLLNRFLLQSGPGSDSRTTWRHSAASGVPNSKNFFIAINDGVFHWNLDNDRTNPGLIAAPSASPLFPPDPSPVIPAAWPASTDIQQLRAIDDNRVLVLAGYRLYLVPRNGNTTTELQFTLNFGAGIANLPLRVWFENQEWWVSFIAGRLPNGNGTCIGISPVSDPTRARKVYGECGTPREGTLSLHQVLTSPRLPPLIDHATIDAPNASNGFVDLLLAEPGALLSYEDLLSGLRVDAVGLTGYRGAHAETIAGNLLTLGRGTVCHPEWITYNSDHLLNASNGWEYYPTSGDVCPSTSDGGYCVCGENVVAKAVAWKREDYRYAEEFYVLVEIAHADGTKQMVRFEMKYCNVTGPAPTGGSRIAGPGSSDNAVATTTIVVAIAVPVGVLVIVVIVVAALLLLRGRGDRNNSAAPNEPVADGSASVEMKNTIASPVVGGSTSFGATESRLAKLSDDDASDIADSDDSDGAGDLLHCGAANGDGDLPSLSHVPAASMANYDSDAIDDEQRFLLKLFPPTLEERRRFKLCRRRVEKRRYTKGRLLGRGANGSVYSVLLKDGSTIAMKEINLMGSDAEVAGQVDAVMAEMRMLARLAHPNLIKYYGVTPDRENLQVRLFMENISGGSLASLVQSMDAALDERLAQRYTVQIVRGLAVIHESGIVHRDMKCDNVLIDSATGCVKLADFGTAKSVAGRGGGATAQMAQTMIGTPYFMAPEIIMASTVDEAEAGYGRKADIWSLGILVAEMLSQGNPPWPPFPTPAHAFMHIANPASQPVLPEGLSAGAADFIRLCTRRDPRERPAAVELLRHEWLSGMQQYNPGRNDPLSRTS